jgi:hypothetical protein
MVIQKICMFPQIQVTLLTMTLRKAHNHSPGSGKNPLANSGSVLAAVAVVACCTLNGCSTQPEQKAQQALTDLLGAIVSPSANSATSSFSDMPPWIDLYREKNVRNVSTVDHVVIVTFETKGGRDEVYSHYVDKFGNEENFASFRDNRDIISFIREGFGVKITLLDQSKNLWSLEYHRQMI